MIIRQIFQPGVCTLQDPDHIQIHHAAQGAILQPQKKEIWNLEETLKQSVFCLHTRGQNVYYSQESSE